MKKATRKSALRNTGRLGGLTLAVLLTAAACGGGLLEAIGPPIEEPPPTTVPSTTTTVPITTSTTTTTTVPESIMLSGRGHQILEPIYLAAGRWRYLITGRVSFSADSDKGHYLITMGNLHCEEEQPCEQGGWLEVSEGGDTFYPTVDATIHGKVRDWTLTFEYTR